MRIGEIILEIKDTGVSAADMPEEHTDAIKGGLSMPDISMNKTGGSPYLQYRMGIAMAGAPDFPTKAAGAFAGDPILSTYTDEELEIINAAAQSVGAGRVVKISDNRSTELSNTNKTSPVRAKQKNQYGV